MKLAFVTDNHFDADSKFSETVRVHDFIAADAAARGCAGTLLGGDMFERKSVPADRNAAGDWLMKMASFGPVVGVYGNHESPNDLDLFNHLEASHPIRIHAEPDVDRIGDALIACVPWPRKAALLAKYGHVGLEQGNVAATAYLRQTFRGLAEAMDDHGELARIALAHVMIDGATTDHDQPIVGADMAVSLADLGLLRAHFYACGHVHAQQAFRIGEAACIYGGSTHHNNFGEPGPKGYTVIDVEGGQVVGWERVPTPATPMRLLAGEWSDDGLTGIALDAGALEGSRGAECRLRYRVSADRRDAARAHAEELRRMMLQDGALAVKIEEEVIAMTRIRAPEVAIARTLPEQLAAFWDSRAEEITDNRRERLLGKLSVIEEEVQRAA